MRYSCVLLLSLMLGCAATVSAAERRTRAVDAAAVEALELAVTRSPLVRSLVDVIEASDLIVHIQTSLDLPQALGGATRFVVSRGGFRYVRIQIRAGLPVHLRSAILGHELRHACEIAGSAAADRDSLRRLFEHAGHRVGEYFETRGAIETERQVRIELRRRLQAEPVVKFDH